MAHCSVVTRFIADQKKLVTNEQDIRFGDSFIAIKRRVIGRYKRGNGRQRRNRDHALEHASVVLRRTQAGRTTVMCSNVHAVKLHSVFVVRTQLFQ